MCHKATIRSWTVLLSLGIALGQAVPDWRKVGNTAVDLMLAAPVTGPVDAVWFSADGTQLFARARSGNVYETLDFESWIPAGNAVPPADPEAPVSAQRLPVAGAKLVAGGRGRDYALAKDLYRSDDGGRTWTDLTSFQGESVIGPGQHSLAVALNEPNELVVSNDFGVWRSMDGGFSWSGLNQDLPNLMVRRIVATPAGAAGLQILVEGLGVVEWQPGNSSGWQLASAPALEAEARDRRTFSAALAADISAVAASGDNIYAGASDGRIWVSFDPACSWTSSRQASGNPVEKIFVDPVEPRVALAALGGSGRHVLRTTNNGTFWDDLTSNLPDVPAYGIAADRGSGAVYVAMQDGVFFARTDLENAAQASVSWFSLSDRLPHAPARDVRLDAAGNQLYVALEGYGIYATAAPHRASTLRLVNAADFSSRPAAPGSLLSVWGGRISAATAGGLHFPVLAASDSESQIQVPFEAVGPKVSLELNAASGHFAFGLPVQPVSPAIFVSRDGIPMLLDADSGLMLDAHNVAHSNSRIQILATGLGKVRPDWPTGLAAPLENPPEVAATVTAFLDRAPVEVTRAVLAPGYVGFYLIELQLPAIVNAGPAELYIDAGGQESNRVQVFLEP
ncbi:MAG: hypothetical protein M1436_02945 [Acidobacteria bacterium]|nr:hypothetical protein [Acidobacteriota bacterium]